MELLPLPTTVGSHYEALDGPAQLFWDISCHCSLCDKNKLFEATNPCGLSFSWFSWL